LIKMILVYELGLRHDSWHDFLSRNGFEESNPPQVDKPMVTEANLPLCLIAFYYPNLNPTHLRICLWL
jgi:hypothetical protein